MDVDIQFSMSCARFVLKCSPPPPSVYFKCPSSSVLFVLLYPCVPQQLSLGNVKNTK